MDTILKARLMKAGTALLVVFAVYGAVLALSALKNYRYIGGGYGNVITVSGEGEVFAVADIAQFGFSVVAERATLTEAQDASAKSMNDIIAYLREAGIEERDIKTTNYSANPRYEYRDATAVSYPSMGGGMEPAIMPMWGGGDTRVLVGYEVRQNITVKVRNTDTVGDIVTGVGSRGATDIYGPDFTIDDSDELKREARELAIKDAQEKARDLAKDLDVRLVRVVSFSENGGGYYPMYRAEMSMMDSAGGVSVAPELPAGENRVASYVTITYEIR